MFLPYCRTVSELNTGNGYTGYPFAKKDLDSRQQYLQCEGQGQPVFQDLQGMGIPGDHVQAQISCRLHEWMIAFDPADRHDGSVDVRVLAFSLAQVIRREAGVREEMDHKIHTGVATAAKNLWRDRNASLVDLCAFPFTPLQLKEGLFSFEVAKPSQPLQYVSHCLDVFQSFADEHDVAGQPAVGNLHPERLVPVDKSDAGVAAVKRLVCLKNCQIVKPHIPPQRHSAGAGCISHRVVTYDGVHAGGAGKFNLAFCESHAHCQFADRFFSGLPTTSPGCSVTALPGRWDVFTTTKGISSCPKASSALLMSRPAQILSSALNTPATVAVFL